MHPSRAPFIIRRPTLTVEAGSITLTNAQVVNSPRYSIMHLIIKRILTISNNTPLQEDSITTVAIVALKEGFTALMS